MWSRARQGLTISAITLILMLAFLEAGTRIMAGIPLTEATNFVKTKRVLLTGTYQTQYDSTLGWIPKPGQYEPEDILWNTRVTIGEDGIRSNGRDWPSESVSSQRILAVGDSFTFGDEVSDDETWPAILETIGRAQVINAGVFGYGLDQTVLRAEMLVEEYQPHILIVGMIPDDINRVELSMRGSAAKPYFELENGDITLKNVPPDPSRLELEEMGILQQVFGYSAFLNLVMNLANLQNAWYGIEPKDVQVHENGVEVSCRLLKKVARLSEREGFRSILLIQYLEPEIYQEKAESVRDIVNCAQDHEILVLDLYDSLKVLAKQNPDEFQSLYTIHMTPTGNRYVAERLLELLIRTDLFSLPDNQ